MKKVLLSSILLLFCSVFLAFSQGSDNEFQQLLSKVQPIFSKNVEQLSKEDLNTLNKVIDMSPNAFGDGNSRLCNNLINQAKSKKKEYDQFISSKQNMSETLDELDSETDMRRAAEAREEVLITENMSLKELIATLQAKIAKFEAQTKKLTQANKKLQNENMASKELLQTSSDLVAQMLMLMPKIALDNSTMNELPQSLKDSLENAQCGVAQLLKSNFLITIQQLKANQPFMDSAAAYFKANNKHSVEITGYIDHCNELVTRLRSSKIECAIGYAADIENEMNSFLLAIENQGDKSGFIDFILNNIAWIGPVCLAVLVGIILLIRKTSTKKS